MLNYSGKLQQWNSLSWKGARVRFVWICSAMDPLRLSFFSPQARRESKLWVRGNLYVICSYFQPPAVSAMAFRRCCILLGFFSPPAFSNTYNIRPVCVHFYSNACLKHSEKSAGFSQVPGRPRPWSAGALHLSQLSHGQSPRNCTPVLIL